MVEAIPKMIKTVDGHVPNPKLPKRLAVNHKIFFVKPDKKNKNADPDGLWNAGYAEITSFFTKDNSHAHLTAAWDEIKNITVKSDSYPGRNEAKTLDKYNKSLDTARENGKPGEVFKLLNDGPPRGSKRGNFEILPEHIVCVFREIEESEDDNESI